MQRNESSILGLIFLTVFLDMVGFSIIFPLFPAMLEHYVAAEGPASAVGRLAASLQHISQNSFAVITLFGGVLGSLYSLLQFLFAPIWGMLSDRIGRRPTLLVTLCGTAISYLLWVFAGTFALLVVARIVGGMMAGNVSTASAIVADTHSGPDRAKGMGILGAGIGLGFVVGPAIGGITSGWDLLSSWPGGAAWGINPFSGPAAAALLLSLLNLAWAWRKLPETAEPASSERDSVTTDSATDSGSSMSRRWNPLGTLRSLDFPGVRATNMAYFVFFSAFGAMEFTLTFLARERLAYTPRQNMWMFVFVGLVIALVQGGLVRRVAPKYGERRLATFGIGTTIPGLLLVGWTTSELQLYIGLFFLAVGSALVMPSCSALISRYTPDDRQGLALGVFRSLGALARVIGPLAGGLLYWSLGSWSPYVVAAVVVLIPLALTARLPAVPTRD